MISMQNVKLLKFMNNHQKAIVFFDIQRGKIKIGRIKAQLWADYLPKTCQNFRQLCTGQYIKNDKPTGYKQSCLYSVSEDSVRGGDYINNNGSGQESIYGQSFKQSPSKPYQIQQGSNWILSMVKNKQKKWGITFEISAVWGKQKWSSLQPFGQITQQNSIKVLKQILDTPTIQNKPKTPLVIFECGQM